MAGQVKRGSYDPYRNLHYAYDGSAVRVLDGDERVLPRPKVAPRRQEVVRPKVAARPAGKVSIFAVAGFAAVAVMAVMILMSFVTLSTVSGEVITLNGQMAQLKSEEATLLARYELAYDLGAIENAVTADGSMSHPQVGQTIYVDLAEPDSVVVYTPETPSSAGFWDGVEETVGNILAYFQGDRT